MALEKIGLGGELRFNSKPAIDSMGRARNEFGQFVKQTDRVPPSLRRVSQALTRVSASLKTTMGGFKRGGQQMAGGLRDIGLGFAPVSLGVGAAISQAASFEKQMSGVGAVSRANTKDMMALSSEARKMGIVSVFSATQAGEGMEFMARAGAKPTEIIAGLGGVMNAAAADGISLGQSADIVAKVTKGLGKEWSEAAHIADTLALASASSNTSILALGESFVYGVSTSKAMNVSLEETTAIFAKLADAGLRGSMGGTAYANMMGKLSKPSTKAQKILKKFGVELVDNDGKLRKIASITGDFNKKLSKITDVTERQAIAIEVFGKRGSRAYNALATAGEEATLALEKSLIESSKDGGAALEMAKRRLDNFAGSVTLLKSSLEGLSIGFFGPLMKPFATSIRQFTEGFNKVLLALNDINDATVDGKTDFEKLGDPIAKFGITATNIAFGLRDAINAVANAWEWVTNKIKTASKWFEKTFGAKGGLRRITKLVTLFLLAGAALTPIILGLGMAKFIIGGLISVFSGMATIVSAAFWPALVAVGALIFAWSLLKKENESFFQTAIRVWSDIKTTVNDFWQNVLRPLWLGISDTFVPILQDLGVVWDEIITNVKMVFSDLFNFIFGGLDGVEIDWRFVGNVIGSVIGAIAKSILTFVKYAIPIIASIGIAIYKVFSFVWGVVKYFITQIAEGFAKLAIGFTDIFEGNIVRGLAKIGISLMDFVLKPIRMIIEGALMLADAVGIDVPKGLRKFAKEGAFGLVFGVPPEGPKAPVKKGMTRSEMMATIGAETMGIATKKEGGVTKPKIQVDNIIEDKRELNINVDNKIDGESLSLAQSRHKVEINERSGFKTTPWQRRAALEHGAVPVSR